MVKEFVQAWDKNKDALREYIKTHGQDEYGSYGDLVKILFDVVINPHITTLVHQTTYGYTYSYKPYDTENIHVIDDGGYQGSLIFLLHEDTYQPSPGEYVYTSVYYGSCSGCDTLLAINDYSDGFPDDDQVNDYMTLCLHLLQNCHTMDETEDEDE